MNFLSKYSIDQQPICVVPPVFETNFEIKKYLNLMCLYYKKNSLILRLNIYFNWMLCVAGSRLRHSREQYVQFDGVCRGHRYVTRRRRLHQSPGHRLQRQCTSVQSESAASDRLRECNGRHYTLPIQRIRSRHGKKQTFWVNEYDYTLPLNSPQLNLEKSMIATFSHVIQFFNIS